jgi:hypothetical protein
MCPFCPRRYVGFWTFFGHVFHIMHVEPAYKLCPKCLGIIIFPGFLLLEKYDMIKYMFRVFKPYYIMHYKAPIVIFTNNGKKIEITDKIASKIVKKKDSLKTIHDKIIESLYYR